MRLPSRLPRGRRGRIASLGFVIACLLVADVATWASRSGSAASTRVSGRTSPGGVVEPTPSEESTVPLLAGAPPSTGSSAPASGSTTPAGPVRVAAGAGSATVTWDPFKTSSPIRYYSVAANEAALGYSGTMVVCGTCTTATFKGLKNGGHYTFTVVPTTSAGAGKGLQSPVAVPASDLCPSGQACVAVDAAVPTGTANSSAQGFLHSIDQSTDSSRVAALRPRFWRGHGGTYFNGIVAPYGVEMTQILSDYWVYFNWDKDKGGANPPWADWAAYSDFVTKMVKLAKDQGWTPTYWEIQNEPDAGYPYVPGTDASIENTLAVYQHGYEALKAADPNAKVLGPGLSGFTITRVPAHPEILDLTTFLDFANAHNLRFDALSLHETGAEHLPQPSTVSLTRSKATSPSSAASSSAGPTSARRASS